MPTNDYAPFSFAWITDVHNGRYSYEPNHPQADINHILGLDPDFTIMSGDCSDNGTLEQLQGYMNLWPNGCSVYHLSGNHDEVGDYDDPPPNDYTNYEATVNSFHWAFTYRGIRFIGFRTDLNRDMYPGAGHVRKPERSFVEVNLSVTMPNFLFTHFPFNDLLGNNVHDWWNFDGGNGWLNNLAATYDIKLFTGHRHLAGLNMVTSPSSPMIEVNGGCLSHDLGNGNGSFQVVTVNGDSIEIKRYLGREPYNLLETLVI